MAHTFSRARSLSRMSTEPEDLLLPEDARLVHIGPQKTGSTALQAAIHEHRAAMREHGVTAVGTEPEERRALWAALMHHDSPEPRYGGDLARWTALTDEVAQARGRVVLSNESLGKADDDGARRMVGALGGDRAHVLAVARRLDRLLPSQWQQRVRMHATSLSYDEWLEVVLGDHPDDPLWRNIWVPHDLEGLVARWTEAADPARFTLLVADESDRRLLSHTVERMLGLPDGTLRPEETHRHNASLSYGRLEVARLLARQLEGSDVDEALRKRVARAMKRHEPFPAEQRMPELPSWARERVAELSDARAELVRALGVAVVGDPDHLRLPPAASDASDASPAVVPAELAAFTVATALELAAERERALRAEHDRVVRRLRRRVRRLRDSGSAVAGPAGGVRDRLRRLRS